MLQSHQLELVETTGWPPLLSLSAKSRQLGESFKGSSKWPPTEQWYLTLSEWLSRDRH